MSPFAPALTLWVPVGHSGADVAAPANFLMGQTSDKPFVRAAAEVGEQDLARGGSRTAIDCAMDRYAAGDDAAFHELHRLAAPRLRGFLSRMCGERPLADDLLQETFLRVCAARGNFEDGAPALPWLLTVARNVFLDHTRRSRLRPSAGADKARVAPERHAAPDTHGDEVLSGREMLDVVRTTLAQMTLPQREAFVLVRFEGLSAKDAAQVLGTTPTAVKIRAFRAYEALRAALAKNGFGSK